jgi:hypothetical protein
MHFVVLCTICCQRLIRFLLVVVAGIDCDSLHGEICARTGGHVAGSSPGLSQNNSIDRTVGVRRLIDSLMFVRMCSSRLVCVDGRPFS